MAGNSSKTGKRRKKTSGQKKTPLIGAASVKPSAVGRFFERHAHAWLWLSGGLPVAGLLVIYICVGIYPFGDYSVANVDMLQQYVPFYASLKHAVAGGGLAYDGTLGLGGSYWGMLGYYLTSPFAALSLLVPDDRLLDYMAVQELVKVGLAGMSFGYFCRRKFDRCDAAVPMLAFCYAMSAFFLTHLSTIIWSDCLVLLPLIVWGLEELLRGSKPWLYVLCLSAAGIANYYIALMIGIYLVLYTAVFLATACFHAGRRAILKKILMFAVSSLLSAGVAAVILLPSALLLRESGSEAEDAAHGFLTMNPLRVIPQLLYHADNRVLADDALPLLYCSVAVVICLPLFFICREIPARIRISFGALAGFLVLSFAVSGLNDLWHGAHVPNRLPFRFAFLLVFTLLVMAGYVWQNLSSLHALTVDLVLLGVMAVTGAAYFAQGAGDPIMLVGTLLTAVGYTVILVLCAEKKIRPAAALLAVLVLVSAEMTSGGVLAWKKMGEESSFAKREEYIRHVHRMQSIVRELAVSDSDVYRTASLTEVTFNDSALAGYDGMSCFSSTNSKALMNLLFRTGYNSDRRVAYYYKSFTPLMDSVLNLKYVVYGDDMGNPPFLRKTGSNDGYAVYRNTLALPRAFAVSDGLRAWNTRQANPFAVQNDFVRKAVSDSDLTVYEPLALAPEASQTVGCRYEDGRVTIAQTGRLVLSAVAEKRRHLYGYIDCAGASDLILTVGDRHYRISDKDAYVTDLGWWEPGETFSVDVVSDQPLQGRIYAALLDEAALERGIAGMAKAPAVCREYGGTRVVCEAETDRDGLLFTSIPYEKGWRAIVNGKPADVVPVGGGLIGIPLSEGSNRVELRYRVRGLAAGILLSAASLLLAVWLLFGREMILWGQTRLRSHIT